MRLKNHFLHLLILGELAILALVLVLGLTKKIPEKNEPKEEVLYTQESTEDVSTYFSDLEPTEDEPAASEPAEGEDDAENQLPVFSDEVAAVLENMSTEEKVAQLFIVSPETLTGNERVTLAGEGTRTALTNYPVGGIVYDSLNYMGNEQAKNLINNAQSMSKKLNGQYLFTGILEEDENGASLMVSHIGQEAQLGSLLALNSAIDDSIRAEFIQIPICKSMEQLSGALATEDVVCYMVSTGGEEAVEAVNNGAEMLCVKDNFQDIYGKVLEAVSQQEISEEVLDSATGRIISKKQSVFRQESGNEEE